MGRILRRVVAATLPELSEWILESFRIYLDHAYLKDRQFQLWF